MVILASVLSIKNQKRVLPPYNPLLPLWREWGWGGDLKSKLYHHLSESTKVSN